MRSTGVKTRRKAEEVARTLFSELLEAPRRWSLTRSSDVYFPYDKANLAPSTVLMYQATLNAFRRLIGDKSLKAYTIHDIELKNHHPHAAPLNDCVYWMLVSRPQKEGHVFTLPCGRRLLAASGSHKFKEAIKKAGPATPPIAARP